MPRIEFDEVSKRYTEDAIAVDDLSLTVEDGMFLCILGPSGCGKSSTLRMLAGLETISSGEIRVDGRRINELEPQTRDFAMVFENYALYPHLNVFGNLAMPLVARRRPRREIRERVERVAETLQITQHLQKRPRQLSGGERQRVGLGRAIIRDTRTFLMDEPLGHLEAYLRVQLRAEIRRLHERLGATTVYITHDQEEAAAVSDRIAVMSEGRLQQSGDLLTLLDNPVNRFVAEFIGDLPISIMPASLGSANGKLGLSAGDAHLPLAEKQARHLGSVNAGDGPLAFGIRPRDVTLHEQPASDRLPLEVAVIEPQGDATVVIGKTAIGSLSARVPSHQAPPPNTEIHAAFDIERLQLFDDSGNNLLHRPS
ncbi:MAG: ABC transporter ATP-binding protein [Alphaproteobacteria bacterium]|nr:ABC transporter ATP-binding protein [Alphaproteobacteria bacterium]